MKRPLANMFLATGIVAAALGGSGGSWSAEQGGATAYWSHPPMRPLPTASGRPVGNEAARFVDCRKGDDRQQGTAEAPWRTIQHALEQLRPGDTLHLRAGTYYERIVCRMAGTADAPITIRSYPGELVVLDGGFREFFDRPAEAWEPVPGGEEGEFRSTGAYPELAQPADPRQPVVASGAYAESVYVLGNFGDSMVPLHGYHSLGDLRSKNEFWNLRDKLDVEQSIYCGPGLWFDRQTERIHVRLAHTTLKGLDGSNYRGGTDPRKVPLVVGGRGAVVDVDGAKHVRFQDLVVRGTRGRTVNVRGANEIELDGLTVYGGCPALFVEGTSGLRMVDCALRGVSAPWSFRTSEKYRGISTYLFIAGGGAPRNRDFEIACCEFTDCHDGLILGTVDALRFHHNFVDNFNDDGLYLTTDGKPGRDVHIYQNRLGRCLTTFSFAGKGDDQEGTDASIFRNVIDLREPVHYHQPKGPAEPQEITTFGRLCSDHGGPIWKPMRFYQNTVIAADPAFRNYYGAGLGGHLKGTKRSVLNNVFVQVRGLPGLNVAVPADDFQADGNLHWSVSDGANLDYDFLEEFRRSRAFTGSKAPYPPGWATNDLFADPGFLTFSGAGTTENDYRLRPNSPAIDAGVPVPEQWPDPLRETDRGRPDLGALPLGCEQWGVGLHGRIPVSRLGPVSERKSRSP
jgi:hypothetical protein